LSILARARGRGGGAFPERTNADAEFNASRTKTTLGDSRDGQQSDPPLPARPLFTPLTRRAYPPRTRSPPQREDGEPHRPEIQGKSWVRPGNAQAGLSASALYQSRLSSRSVLETTQAVPQHTSKPLELFSRATADTIACIRFPFVAPPAASSLKPLVTGRWLSSQVWH